LFASVESVRPKLNKVLVHTAQILHHEAMRISSLVGPKPRRFA